MTVLYSISRSVLIFAWNYQLRSFVAQSRKLGFALFLRKEIPAARKVIAFPCTVFSPAFLCLHILVDSNVLPHPGNPLNDSSRALKRQYI